MDINFFQELKKEGGQGFYVGGFVRDKLMGYESKDFDIEVLELKEINFKLYWKNMVQ